MNIEIALVSKILHTGDFVIVTDMQINGSFLSGRNRKAFAFIKEHMLKYGKTPSLKTFTNKFPSYKLMDKDELDEGLRFYCDELRNKKKHNTLVDTVEEVADLVEELKTEEAFAEIKRMIVQIENEIVLTDRMEINKNTKSRLEDYKQRAQQKGMTGIPSGNTAIDQVLKGFNGGELIAILGYTGTGKSWAKVIMATFMAKMGYRVLLVTKEMSTKMMVRRIDAVWCKLSYTRFRNGNLHDDEYKRYEKYLEEIDGDTDANLIVEQATGGVSQIAAKVEQYKPDIVLIDGAYLLEDEEKGEDDWKAVIRIFRALHALALNKNIPIIASTQSKEKVVELNTISFAKALSNDCDVVMALEQDDEMKADREIKWKFLKIREGSIPGNIVNNWDFDKMKYDPIYIEGYNGDRVNMDAPMDDGDVLVQDGVQTLD